MPRRPPTQTGAARRGAIRAIHCSWRGWPVPTQTSLRAARVDPRDDGVILGGRQLTERRAPGAGDLEAGKARAQVQRERHERALVAPPVEVDGGAAAAARAQQRDISSGP